MPAPRQTPGIILPQRDPQVMTVADVVTPTGRFTLRKTASLSGLQYELLINGTYVMATYCEESESELARCALTTLGKRVNANVLIGGLGVGYTLRETLAFPWVGRVTVVEIEPLVAEWSRTYFRPFNGGALDDPRATVVLDDMRRFIETKGARYDAILLDIDNGPSDAILAQNALLYGEDGLRRWMERLTPNGVFALWSAKRDEAFERRLRRLFGATQTHTVHTGVSLHGPDEDILYVAHRDGQESAGRGF